MMNVTNWLNLTQILNITTRIITTTKAITAAGTPILVDKTTLSTKFQDLTNVFVLPTIAVTGVVLTTIKIIVLADNNLNGRMYQYLLLSSVFDFIKLFTSSFLALFRCGTMCPYGYSFYSKIYEQYIYLYVGNNCTVFGTLLDIVASFDRLLSFNPKLSKASEKFLSFRLKCVFLFILSIGLNYPEYVLTRSVTEKARLIVPTSNSLRNVSNYLTNSTIQSYYLESLFVVADNDLAKIILIKTSLLVINLIRKLTLLSILLVINLLIAVKFTKHMKKKRSMTSSISSLVNLNVKSGVEPTQLSSVIYSQNELKSTASSFKSRVKSVVVKSQDKYGKSEQAVTKMIMIMCISTFFGNILDSFSAILFSLVDSTTYNYHLLFSNATLFSVHAFDILLLYNFNANFKTRFNYKFCWFSSSSVSASTIHENQSKAANIAHAATKNASSIAY